MTEDETQQIAKNNKGSIGELISQLQQFDNPKGYRMEYEDVKEKLGPIVAQIAQKGEAALNQLHELLEYEESWSCQFALEALKEIKSEKSIPHLIEFIKKNEESDNIGSCNEALFALEAIGKPAVEPLLAEVKNEFADENFPGYLVEGLTDIKDDRVYNFMIETTQDYLKNKEKYEDWFEADAFTCGFADQGNREALALMKRVLASGVSEEERNEIESAIEKLDDPEEYQRKIQEMAEEYKDFDMSEEAAEAIKVNCDFCGKEMECPPDMLEKAKKQMCGECFFQRKESGKEQELKNVHVDISPRDLAQNVANGITNSMVEDIFPDLWDEKKEELRELSKKELALEMFGAGAYNALANFIEANSKRKDGNKRKVGTNRI